MKTNILILIILSFFIVSCSSKEEKIVFKKPQTQIPKIFLPQKRNKGSLYSMQGASLFADKKDLQIGDIIQIRIDEKLNSDSDNLRELTADRSNVLGGGILGSASNNNASGLAGKLATNFNAGLGVDFTSNSSVSDSGQATSTHSESFQTTISAIIEETYQNGNYYIKGIKELLIDGQKQEIIISGVIRPYDIGSDNSISSSQIANLKVLYDKAGDEGDILETPWGLKILRMIWPF